MAISEFSSKGVPRSKIAFFESVPDKDNLVRFKERKFQCEPCDEARLSDTTYLAQLDAIVFSQVTNKPSDLSEVLRKVVPGALDHGVRIYVRIALDPSGKTTTRDLLVDALVTLRVPLAKLQPEEYKRIPGELREREGSFLAPLVYLFDAGESWKEVARVVCDHPAGDAPDIYLEPAGIDLVGTTDEGAKERLLLLQRAFSDCESLLLKPMPGGLSGAPTFKAYASLKSGLADKWPYLHFVKVGPRKKIIDEYDHYIGRTLDYVPFYLGPRLRLDRCNLGSTQGILVGDFVEGAEPIRDCAASGRVGQAIPNLFDRTLGPWRKQAKNDSDLSLGGYLSSKWLTEQGGLEIAVPDDRSELVRSLGGNTSIPKLRSTFESYSQTPALCAPAHGDLHATNVLVRGGDAIIIDFEKMVAKYPLLYDPASLEGGLLVEGFENDKRTTADPLALMESIAPLYTLDALIRRHRPCHPAEPSSWYFDCAEQIRGVTRSNELSPGQYALVLALCLIRKGCNPHNFESWRRNLRAIAFCLGQKILDQIDAQGLN